MKEYYPGDEYHTQAGTSRAFGDYLLLGTRCYFHLNILGVVWRARRMAAAGEFDDSAWVDISFQILQCIERAGGKCHFTGLDNITKADGPVVFVGNHMSVAETFLMPSIIVSRKPATFVVKKKLLDYPFFGTILKSRSPIAVGREDPRGDLKAVLTEGCDRILSGTSVVVFPQSTRMPKFNPSKFNTIGVKLAKKAGVPIVPFALKTDFWSTAPILKDLGPIHRKKQIHIEFAPPLEVSGNGKDAQSAVIDFIQTKLAEWTAADK